MTDATTSPDDTTAPEAPGEPVDGSTAPPATESADGTAEIDLDAIETDLNRVELALEQLFFQRPAPHYADYRSPIDGLYQCGSSTHPGGGVSGIPGHNSALEILKDWKRLQAA